MILKEKLISMEMDDLTLEDSVNPALEVEMNENTLNLRLFGPITKGSDNSADAFRKVLSEHPTVETIHLTINSRGGDVDEANAILQELQSFGAQIVVTVGNMAASAAGLVAMAGNHIRMFPTSSIMVHNPSTQWSGNAESFRHIADILDSRAEAVRKAYVMKAKGKISEEQIKAFMDAETYLTADKCLEYGLCDEIIGLTPVMEENENQEEEPDEPTIEDDGWFFL